MAFNKLSKMFESEEILGSDAEYTKQSKKASKEVIEDGNKMILVEPRAYSESQQIADHLKAKNSVLVNFKRVTSDQAKRIIDFLGGTLYAIGGDLQKVGNGIYLCTPKNINVQGKITEDDGKTEKVNDDLVEW